MGGGFGMSSRPFPDPANSSLAKIERFFGLSQTVIEHQIEAHKYFLNLSVNHELSRQEVEESWNQAVFAPLMEAIEDEGLETDFPASGWTSFLSK